MIKETEGNLKEGEIELFPEEGQDMSESPKIEISREGFKGNIKELESILGKYDISNMVSQLTGLGWKTDSIKLKHTEGSVDWEGNDTVLENLKYGPYCISSLSHEMVHLIFRQNDWLESDEISNFIEKYPEMNEYSEGKDGYPIEQMVAYLIQDEICKKIGQEEDADILTKTGGHRDFENILDREYDTEMKRWLGKTIINNWTDRGRYPNIIKWIESLLKEANNG